jgi:signal transduction histidine kinase
VELDPAIWFWAKDDFVNRPHFIARVSRQFARRRFRPFDLAVAILFAGWVPSILLALISYTVLKDTLEQEIIGDRRTLVQTLGTLIGNDLDRSGEVMAYYQTLPETAEILRQEPGNPGAEEWLEEIYYSQPRLDGMFLADATGGLFASIPPDPLLIGTKHTPELWLKGAAAAGTFYVSPVLARPTDGRMATFIVVSVRSQSGEIIGYMGASILVERIGRRLTDFDFGKQTIAQVIDQTGFPLFDRTFKPNKPDVNSDNVAFYRTLGENPRGVVEHNGRLFMFEPVAGADWTAILHEPLSVAYAPVRNLLSKTTVLAAWLVIGTAVAAWLVSQLYRSQLLADDRIARETFFNEAILANMPIGVALVDPVSRKFLQSNQSFAALMREFGGVDLDVDDGNLKFDDLQLGLSSFFEKVVSLGQPYVEHEKRVTDLRGKEHFLTLSLLRLRDLQGRTQGVLFMVENNTNDVSMRRELIEANASKDRFLALLSHELRNPLSPVITMVAELERRNGTDHEALEVIRRNVELEARLIDDLLDITRIANDKLKLTMETVSAHDVIERAVEICEGEVTAKGLALELDLNAEHHFVKADPARLQQVFWNLIKNAVKFTERGTVKVSSLNDEAGNLIVRVADTGLGIGEDRMVRIFNAFEQGEAEITRRFGGLGLGLAISKTMVEAHGGKISVESEGAGAGSVFTVELKITEPVKIELQEVASVPVSHDDGKEKRVLLVDDHFDTCLGLKMLLQRRGYSVEIAHSVSDGIQLAREFEPDLVISDLGLPDGSGFELIRAVKSFREVYGVALSGFGMESDIERSREAGFHDHLIKPLNLERLDQILHMAFR